MTTGKTSTSALIAYVLEQCGEDPTFLIGGVVPQLGTNARVGRGRHVVAEADESDGSLAQLRPRAAVVLNAELDHHDHFGSLDDLHALFRRWVGELPHEGLLVITNNLNVAMLLYRHPRIEVIVAGGTVRRADGALIGSTAVSLIGQFKVDYAIIGASAIDEEGALLDFDYREVQAAQAIIANARSVMLVADSTKLRRSAPVRIAHMSQIQTFVTDAPLPAGLANICHTRGIAVIEAMPRATDSDEDSTVTPLRAR